MTGHKAFFFVLLAPLGIGLLIGFNALDRRKPVTEIQTATEVQTVPEITNSLVFGRSITRTRPRCAISASPKIQHECPYGKHMIAMYNTCVGEDAGYETFGDLCNTVCLGRNTQAERCGDIVIRFTDGTLFKTNFNGKAIDYGW